MNRHFFKHLAWLPVLLPVGCVQTEIIPEVLEPKLTLSPAAISLMPGLSATLTGTYTDEMGEARPELLFSTLFFIKNHN